MIRLNFALGLTVILLLMLLLGGFTVIQTRKHSREVSSLMSENYGTIKSGQRMLQTFTELNALYLSVPEKDALPDDRKEWEAAHAFISRYLAGLRNGGDLYEDPELITSLTVKVERYLDLFSKYLDPEDRKSEGEFQTYQQRISEIRKEIDTLILNVFRENEAIMFERRDQLAHSVNTTALIVIMIVLGSLIVYLITSFQMTRSIIYPLMDLKEGILQVRQKKFDIQIQEPKSRELAEIAESFNFMAEELRKFYAETDHRVMVATKTSQRIIDSLPYPNYVVDDKCELVLVNPLAEELNATLGAKGLPSPVRAKAMEAISQNQDQFTNAVGQSVKLGSGDAALDVLPQIFSISRGNEEERSLWGVLLIDVTNLRAMDRAKTNALSLLGHEVKTPVSSMRMALQLLLEEDVGKLTPDQRELVNSSYQDCQRLFTTLEGLLELARLESGREALQKVEIGVEELISEVVKNHTQQAELRGVPLQSDIDPNLPPIHIDTLRFGRVLSNLVSNAIKYGYEERPVLIKVRMISGRTMRISVINEGDGLGEEDIAKVFDPFFRKPGTKQEGSGFGLSLAKEIVKAHGGEIHVFSEEKQKTEFYIDLPTSGEIPEA